MNRDDAAAVRDAVNDCPDVIDPSDEDVKQRDRDPFTNLKGDTFTGDRVTTRRSAFRPAYVEQVGEISADGGEKQPVHAVILEPLWTEKNPAMSLSPEIVWAAAKHDCRIRFYPENHRLGRSVWIVDPFRAIEQQRRERADA